MKQPLLQRILFPVQQQKKSPVSFTALYSSSSILVLCSADGAWQAAILQHELIRRGFHVLTCGVSKGLDILEQRSSQSNHAGVILWFLSDGMLQDSDVCDAAERAVRVEAVAHLCVHENDDRKARFRFNWSTQLEPLSSRDGALAAQLQAKLSRLESVPFERRSFLQAAMFETILGRLASLAALAVARGGAGRVGGCDRRSSYHVAAGEEL